MRTIRLAQAKNCSEHESGVQLKTVIALLDEYPDMLKFVKNEYIDKSFKPVGRN